MQKLSHNNKTLLDLIVAAFFLLTSLLAVSHFHYSKSKISQLTTNHTNEGSTHECPTCALRTAITGGMLAISSALQTLHIQTDLVLINMSDLIPTQRLLLVADSQAPPNC